MEENVTYVMSELRLRIVGFRSFNVVGERLESESTGKLRQNVI